ncbi:MAG TPA: anaerobic ribonucleoside-triphosphate reductase activating protein [Methanomicrobia archaeon]|nr:anaerobic ribonucleoside-triphosphate reductase activating protein [Methanomicrobia archaeon]HEX58905.1 anaerobic ribonucleoside-triphosphate reductase activating protein [Methanomicrobia archaeon]
MRGEVKANVGGVVHISTVDWHGKVAHVIFFRGCPFRCVYCQNYKILEGENYVSLDELMRGVRDAKFLADAVVFSGGEPLMQFSAVFELARLVREEGLLVAVQTNGFYPGRLEKLLKEKLLDKVFIDVKAPLDDEKYERITGVKGAAARVRESLEVLRREGADFEAVTTVFRGLVAEPEVRKIALELKEIFGRCTHVIQQGRPELAMSEELRREKALSRSEVLELARVAAAFGLEVKIRTKEHGEEVFNLV